jgi:hypothetical protein
MTIPFRLLLTVCVVFLVCESSRGQEASPAPYRFAVKADVLFPSVALFSGYRGGALTLEKSVSPRSSVQGTVLLLTESNHREVVSTVTGLAGEYKYFLSRKKRLTGFYTGIFSKYQSDHYRSTYENGPVYLEFREKRLGAGAILGYQFNLYGDRLLLDILAGTGFSVRLAYEKLAGNHEEPPGTLSDSRGAVNIGWRF